MLSRRHFIKLAGSSSGLLLAACHKRTYQSSTKAHIVIIGGGFGGATAAKTIKQLDSSIKVTLIEPNAHYITCPGSNWVLAGLTNLASLTINYQSLADQYDINIVQDKVRLIKADKHFVSLSDGQKIHYDRLIVSPGIDFRWDVIEGLDESGTYQIPHAWKAGAQTTILKNQLSAMPDGGTVIICAPANPFRCPPGPYERASMIAQYLKRHKAKSKILILDAKSHFSKQSLFIAGWEKHYGFGSNNSMIEWHSIPDNPVTQIDTKNKTLTTDFGDQFKADVLNYIPEQKAGNIAQNSDLCDQSGWCPVNPVNSESTRHSDIHVIGDASNHHPIPKSAFAANSEAKVCAFAVVNLLNGSELLEPSWVNTCYSLITQSHGISVAMVYKLSPQGQLMKVAGAGGISNKPDEYTLSLEADYARNWLESIVYDSFK